MGSLLSFSDRWGSWETACWFSLFNITCKDQAESTTQLSQAPKSLLCSLQHTSFRRCHPKPSGALFAPSLSSTSAPSLSLLFLPHLSLPRSTPHFKFFAFPSLSFYSPSASFSPSAQNLSLDWHWRLIKLAPTFNGLDHQGPRSERSILKMLYLL